VLLLLAMACGESTYFPNTASFPDTGTIGPPVEDLPCDSGSDGSPVGLSVTSVASVELVLFERDDACDETFVGRLGERPLNTDTRIGAAFVARDTDGAAYAWLMVPFADETYTWVIQ
jgi:hypothetical protein